MLEPFLFFVLATVAIVAGLGMLVSRSPVNSALWLVLNLFSIALLYLTLNAQFIAVIQILVYAGAIMVLFLFVIMLLNLGARPGWQDFDWRRGAAFLLGIAVLAQLMYIVALRYDVLPDRMPGAEAAEMGTAANIGRVLFTEYAFPLEITAILLLAATIGAVLLARRHPI